MEELLKNSSILEKYNILTFEDLCNAWLKNVMMSTKESTFSKYCTIIERHVIPEIGKIPIQDITQPLLEKFLMDKHFYGRIQGDKPLSASTIRIISSILHSILQYASRLGIMEFDHILLLKPRTVPKEIRLFSLEEQKNFEQYLLNKKELSAYGIYLTLYTGLRLGELCALTWQDIDLARGSLSIKKTLQRIQLTALSNRYYLEKSGIQPNLQTKQPNSQTQQSSSQTQQSNSQIKQSNSKTKIIIDSPKSYSSIRDIPLAPCLLTMFHSFKSQYSSNCFFLTGKETFMDPRTYQKKFKHFLHECGLENRNFHILRHQFASNCISCGIDPKALSEILGHSSVNITLNRYVHSDFEQKRVQIKKLDFINLPVNP